MAGSSKQELLEDVAWEAFEAGFTAGRKPTSTSVRERFERWWLAVERDDPKGPTGPTKRPAARPLGSIPHAGGPPLAQVGSADQAGAAGGHGVVPLSGDVPSPIGGATEESDA